jgi:type IV secretion system protein TrbG
MRRLFFFIVCFYALSAFADDHPLPQQVTEADLTEAMKDAELEYAEATKHLEPPKKELATSKESRIEASDRQMKPVESKTLLEELAAEVDTLKNKAVIEKTTLLATQSPKKVKMRGSKTVYHYRDDDIYEVTTSVDHVTDIQLQEGETLTTPPTSGDTVRWNLAVMKSGLGPNEITHIIIKPLDEDIETNLIITTDRRIYQLQLKSSDFHMPSVSWNYPKNTRQEFEEALRKKESSEPTISPESLRFTYEIDGDDYSWRPIRVFDDGKKTFIQMPPDISVSESPALFLVEDSSEPMLTNYRVKGSYYIVDRLFTEAELRVGPKKVIRIVFGKRRNFLQRLFS